MNKKLIIASVATMLAVPAMMLAAFQPGQSPNLVMGLNINQLVDAVFGVLWPVAIAFFIIMFVLAAFKFFTAQGDPEGVKDARNFVIWGVVGVVVALLAWSIPFVIKSTLNSNGIGV